MNLEEGLSVASMMKLQSAYAILAEEGVIIFFIYFISQYSIRKVSNQDLLLVRLAVCLVQQPV